MLNPQMKWQFLYALAWAFEVLMMQEKHAEWTQEELDWPHRIRSGEEVKLLRVFPLEDRFAMVFQDLFRHLSRDEHQQVLEEMQKAVFRD